MTAYRIVTPRLVLRCWSPEDAPAVVESITESLDHLRAWMDWAHHEPEPVQKKADRLRRFRAGFDAGRNYTYGVYDRGDDERVIGGIGLHDRIGAGAGEIGYWIHKDHVGKGFATEAAGALTRVGFEHEGLGRIEIHCEPANEASCGVPRKLGFTHQVTVPGYVMSPKAKPRSAKASTNSASE